VLTASGDAVDALLGTGSGAFTRGDSVRPGGIVDSIALADLDGDDRLDLVAATDTELRVFYGLGDGRFRGAQIAATDSAGVAGVFVRDANADGRPDLAYLTDRDELVILTNPRLFQAGLAPYGRGTPDCDGAIVMTGNSRPYLGNLGFEFVIVNAPAHSNGLVAIAFGQDEPGTDPCLGFLFHLLPGPEVNPRFIVADANGGAVDPYAIPELPGLVGGTVYAQTVWLGDLGASCSPSPFGFSSSRGLALTVQPQ
jgi:hypothetical protein